MRGSIVAELKSDYLSLRSKVPKPHVKYGFATAGNCHIFCEAHVAVNAFLKREGNIENGIYFICDVGAGTTDVAFFRYDDRARKRIQFYGATCTLAAGDDFASAIADKLQGEQPSLSRPNAVAMANQMLVARKCPEMSTAFAPIYERIRAGRKLAWGLAYDKRHQLSYWSKALDEGGGAVVGGSQFIPGVRKVCLSPLPSPIEGEFLATNELPLIKPMGDGISELHWIAYGLSYPWQEVFECWLDNELKPWIPPRHLERVLEPYQRPKWV